MSNPSYSESSKSILRTGLDLLRDNLLSDQETASLVNSFSAEHYEEAFPEIETLLDHPFSMVRENALTALGQTFGKTSRMERILQMARTDPDEGVRSSAAMALAGISTEDSRPSILALLSLIVRDLAESDDVRLSAYEAILSIKKVPLVQRLDPSCSKISGIDWSQIL